MKYANARSGDGRGQMRERQRRDRAATQPLRVRFPQFTSLRLDFDFSDDGRFTPAPQVTVLHPPASAYFIFPCPYTDCDGEFNLEPVVNTLATAEQASDEGQLRCSGHRSGSGENRAACQLILEYNIIAKRS
jgi:hypothetical protein